ncbi:flagellar hook-associated protein FlgK [Paremcibacter congregatus]|uniref:Flagellar hook-associated protein 1 n=1 Tax=Paremcibacter congregatus TaxID=2043170 RepID=A0A2G4YUY7_9PROT|nr:flagellar hook-associated protein FlgK [Paremcibacter congregatus]PHZ85266.1 flagellar hook-associated protein FlgK [Paremcibacter congregatus]QDE27802.1 flagellar hook-associated protein FlgK [Paremcibacter congregatus]
MSINSIINNSLTGLFTNQAALRVTSNNVANVNTPGYARQVVRQEAIINGTAVGGVKISGIDRIVDKFLVKASYDANADFSRYEVESAYHSRIQSLLGRPDQNKSLSGKIDDIFSAISEVALNPLSAIQKERALSAIDQFGSEIGSLAEDIQTMRLDASHQIAEQVARINALTERIHTLNPLIIKETLTGGEPGALTESREQAIAELSTIMDINIVDAGNNSVQITTTSGVSLVSAVQTKLQYSPPGVVTSSTPFSAITVHRLDNVSGAVMPSTITLDGEVKSGKLKGLLTLRDKDLPEIALQLGSMASGFTDEMNRVHNMNSAVPGVNLLTGVNTGLLLTDNHNFTGETVFAVTDASGDLVSKVNIDFSAIGPTVGDVVTAVNAGLAGTGTLSFSNGVMSLTATNAAHGITMSEVAGNESNRGGRGFSHFFGLNNLVQSKSPAHFETGVVGTDDHGFTVGGTILIELNDVSGQAIGTHTLTVGGTSFNDILTDLNSSPLSAVATFSLSANGELITTPNPGAGAISVHIKNDTTTRGTTNTSMSAFFGIGEQYKMDSAIDLKVSDRISANPSQMALARLDQTALVGDNVLSVGDQAGALALKELETMTRTYSKAGGLSATTVTLAQYSANLLADLGLRSALADNSMSDNKALSEELNRKATDVSGVNMDEELGNMVIYQNAYSASARLLTTAKEMYDTILQIL